MNATSSRPGALIIGASSGVGAAIATELARHGYALALVARRLDSLDHLAQTLSGDGSAPPIRTYEHDVRDYAAAPALFERIQSDLAASAPLRLVIYAAGVLYGEKASDFEHERETIETNTLGAMRWLSLAAPILANARAGALVGVSSVAGERGRRGSSAYQASKAALSVYLESLRYRLHGSGVRVVTIKPGYVATQMTAGMRLPQRLVTSPEAVARRVVRATKRGSTVVYAPGYWRPIMGVIRALPAFLMTRLPI